jgi:hypothetical protein
VLSTWAIRILYFDTDTSGTGKRVTLTVVCLEIGINGALAIVITVRSEGGRAVGENDMDDQNDKNSWWKPPIHVYKESKQSIAIKGSMYS